jgi:hypothetical protein
VAQTISGMLQVYTGLILVNTGPMKYTLVHRISGFVSALLSQVAQQQESSNREIIDLFETQQETVLRVPGSTEECLQVPPLSDCTSAYDCHLTRDVYCQYCG